MGGLERSRDVHVAARSLLEAGLPEAAADMLREHLASFPRDLNAQGLLAFAANYDPRATNHDLLLEHARFGMLLRERAGPARTRDGVRPARHRTGPIRVGFVSGDLRRHSVACFMEPLLAGLSRAHVETIAYALHRVDDEVSGRLRVLAGGWRALPDADADTLGEAVRRDAPDVVVDLSGLTRGHRLAAFARRLAPVQGAYLGYPASTGVDTIDARLVDAATDPPGAPPEGSESIVRLHRCFVAYGPIVPLPPIATPARRGPVLGCFGHLAKINDRVLAAWGRVLARVPGSSLLVKSISLDDPLVRAKTLDRCRVAGIDPARVELRPRTTREEDHLAAYDAVDVALDTFPYNGVTTTCEALAMGVPVVTFPGDRHAARTGASILRAAGVGEWCAKDEGGYVELASRLAEAGARGESERRSLRERVLASALCDAAALGEAFASAMARLAGGTGAG